MTNIVQKKKVPPERLNITQKKKKMLTIERGNDFSDSFGGSSGGGNDVLSCTTAVTPQFTWGAIHSLLGGSGGVNSGHETLDDLKVIVDHFGQGRQAVGCARSIGDDLRTQIAHLNTSRQKRKSKKTDNS